MGPREHRVIPRCRENGQRENSGAGEEGGKRKLYCCIEEVSVRGGAGVKIYSSYWKCQQAGEIKQPCVLFHKI